MHPPARTHPPTCRFCGGTAFWGLDGGRRQSLCVDRDGNRSCVWDWFAVVRCAKCHATFNAVSDQAETDGALLTWHLGRAR